MILAPPNRSASFPPKGRAREPTRGPRKASETVAVPSWKAEYPVKVSAMSFGNTAENPMKDPKVPM